MPDYEKMYRIEAMRALRLEARARQYERAFEDTRRQLQALNHHLRARFGCELCYEFGHKAQACPSHK
jgi:hypothetical protein